MFFSRRSQAHKARRETRERPTESNPYNDMKGLEDLHGPNGALRFRSVRSFSSCGGGLYDDGVLGSAAASASRPVGPDDSDDGNGNEVVGGRK